MSLKPQVTCPVPPETVRIARAAFPKGNVYLKMESIKKSGGTFVFHLNIVTREHSHKHRCPTVKRRAWIGYRLARCIRGQDIATSVLAA